MSRTSTAIALLAGTALVGSTLTLANGPDTARRSGIDNQLDPTAIARQICSIDPTRRTEAYKPGFQFAIGLGKAAAAEQTSAQSPLLADNLGSLTWKVSTKSDTAQRYFDQGLRLAYGFNHTEARRAFRAAQATDPTCAMCYWGEAFVLGSNINFPMMQDAVEPAFAASSKAQALSSGASPKEQAIIRALARRYSPDPAADRKALDAAYADAMAETAASFGDDDVQALFADALMNLSPWDYWEADAKTPKGRTADMVAAIETVLKRNPDHPGAIHFYIHAVEGSTTPQRAEPYADRLGALVPGAGHLVHMPAHIYYRVGRYKDSLAANIAAAKVDEALFASLQAQGVANDGIYRYGYYPHNVHFVLVSAQMGGDGPTAIAAAGKLDRVMSDAMAREVGWVQAIKQAPYFAHAQFSAPETILALPAPSADFPFILASWHYARAIAFIARGDTTQAHEERKALARLAAADFSMLTAWTVPAPDLIALAGQVLDGRIASREGRMEDAVAAFGRAVELQERVPYMEPPYWYYPVRQSLAAAQLAAGQTDLAIRTFNDTLLTAPDNAYTLYGLAESLRRKGDTVAAKRIDDRFRAAWSGQGMPDLRAF